MNFRFLLSSVFFLAYPAFAQSGPSEDWDARLTSVSGEVTLFASGEDSEGLPASKDTPLETGDRVRTGANSQAEIVLDGGGVIYLRSNSEFTLERMRRSDASFMLALGSLLAKLQSLGGAGLRVRTPTAVAAVRGTEFGVEIPPEAPSETHIGIFDEGKLEVSDVAGGRGERLIANQETVVARGAPPLPPYQLRRFIKHRQFVRSLDRRISSLRKQWKSLDAGRRRELRMGALAASKAARQKSRERAIERQLQRQPRKPRPDQEKMEKRRQRIRERRGQ